MTTVREATIALLREAGMTTIFGNPGSTELPMFRDFPGDFRYVLGLQEAVVIGMADGYAQATRKPGIVNLHSSAGVGHALGNLFTAFKNQTPLVVTAGQQSRGILSYEPFLFAERSGEFPRPFVKWASEPARAEDVPAAIRRAIHVALEPPCGPTFVSIPIDDWDRDCEPIAPRTIHAGRVPERSAIDRCAEAMAAARSPCIVVGAGVARDGAWDAAIALAERHQARVFVAPMSARCSFPEDHRLFAGFLGAFRETIAKTLEPHDFVLALGGPMNLYHADGAGPHVPDGCEVWLIGDNPAHAEWAPAGTAIIAQCDHALAMLLGGPLPAARPDPPRRAAPPAPDGRALTDAWLLHRVAALRPSGSVIVEEAPSSRGAMHDYLPIVSPDTFYTTASGGLGHGLPAAVGIALARPRDKVIALLGDGSAMYAIQGLHAAAQLGVAVSFVIVNNGRYEALHSFGHHFGIQQPVGTQFPELDFVKLAEGHGISGERVDAVAGLDDALVRSFRSGKPSLIEVMVA